MPILETLVAVTGLSAARRLFDKAVDHFFPDKTKSNKAAQPPAPRPVQQEVVYLAQQAQREQAWLVLQKEASEIRKVEVDANFRIAAAEAKRAEYALQLSEQTLAVRRQELALMAERLRHDQALAETQRKALEATLKLRAKELQLLEQGLAAKQELGRQYLELLRQQEAQAIELKQQELQAQWDEQKWAGLLSRQEMHTILRGQEQRHRLLLIVAQPAISQDVPPTIRENLPLELPSELKAFVEEHYPTGDPFCPVQFFGKFFEKPIFDTEVKKLEALLAPLPAAILYSNITDDKVFLHLSFSGGDEGGDASLTETLAWNWEEQQAALVKAGQTERVALRQVRRAIVEMHQFLAAFLTDLYYLSVNPLHEPRLYRLESAPTMTWQHELLDQLRTVQAARSTAYWAEVERVRAEQEARQRAEQEERQRAAQRTAEEQRRQKAEEEHYQAEEQIRETVRSTHAAYEKFQGMRTRLIRLGQQVEQLLQSLMLEQEEQSRLQQLQQNIQSNNFKLLVMGEFNRGKSTLINALLGRRILPSYMARQIAITEVKWAEKPTALLHWEHKRVAQEIPITEVQRYIESGYADHYGTDDSEWEKRLTKISLQKVEIFLNLPLCQQGVELVELPGLGNNAYDVELAQADALLFMIACDFPVSNRELDTLRNEVQARGFEDIFFICNRINMIEEEDRASVKARCRKLLAPFTRYGEQHIFFVDACAALKAREQNDDARLQTTGLPQVETALETFLTKEKGRVKLSRPIHQMKSIIRRVYTEVIPARKALLTAELEQVEMRFAMDDKLAQLQSAIASGLTREINAIRTQVEWAIQQKQHEQAKIEEAHRTLEAAHQQASKLEKALDALAEEVTLA
jgi:hypothetical protein